MEYRIKESYNSDGDSLFFPQYKYKLIPFFMDFKTTYTLYDWSSVRFNTIDEAEEYIKLNIYAKSHKSFTIYHESNY